MPYANFDYHGMAAMAGWLFSFIFAAPIFWLARYIFRSFDTEPAAPMASSEQMTVFGSALIALALDAPTFFQIGYWMALPMKIVWPVPVSSLAWGGIVLTAWIMFLNRPDAPALARFLRVRASLLAAIVTLPKIFIVAPWLLRPTM